MQALMGKVLSFRNSSSSINDITVGNNEAIATILIYTSYHYVICNGIVIKVLQDGYLLPILGDTGCHIIFYGSRISHVLLCAAVAVEQNLSVQSFVLAKTTMYA